MRRRDRLLRVELLEDRLTPTAGAFDPSFGSGGIVTTTQAVRHLALVPDGRILAVVSNTADAVSVERFGPDGTPDSAFGTGGIAPLPGTTANPITSAALAALPDGGALVGWSVFSTAKGTADLVVVRLTSAGDVDPTFGTGGTAVVATPGGTGAAQLSAIRVESDGRVLLAGSQLQSLTGSAPPKTSSGQAVVARLTADGQTDTSFGTGGTAVVEFPAGASGFTTVGDVDVQADGRVVVAGTVNPNGSQNTVVSGPVAFRLTADGRLDPTFGTGGKVVVTFPHQLNGSGFDAVSVLSDGRILLAGLVQVPGDTTFAAAAGGAARLTADGRLDPTYGSGGMAVTSEFSRPVDIGSPVLDAAIDSFNRAVFDGTSIGRGNLYGPGLVFRLNGDGSNDTAFGTNGFVNVGGGSDENMVSGLAVQPNGDILVGGASVQGTFGHLVRLIGSNSPSGFVSAVPGTIAVGGTTDGTVQVLNPANGHYSAAGTLTAYAGFPGNVRSVTADVTGDGTPDYITAAGPGALPVITVFDGKTGATVANISAFESSFSGGVFVAAADLNGDGKAEIVAAPDQGGGPRVVIFSVQPGGGATMTASFFGIDDPNFRGGARVALGDVNKDGTPDLAVAAGFLGGPRVALFDGKTLSGTPTRLVNDFFAFPGDDATTLRNGVFVAAGDVNGDGFAELIFGGGPGGAPRVFVLSGAMVSAGNVAGAQGAPVANFFVAGNSSDRGGVRVAAKDADGDAKADLAVGSGEGDPANVRVYLGKDFTTSAEPGAFQDVAVFGGAALPDGVFVG